MSTMTDPVISDKQTDLPSDPTCAVNKPEDKSGSTQLTGLLLDKVSAAVASETLKETFKSIPVQDGRNAPGLLQIIVEIEKALECKVYPEKSVLLTAVGRTSDPLREELLRAIGNMADWSVTKFLLMQKFIPPSVKEDMMFSYVRRRQRKDERLEDFIRGIILYMKVLLIDLDEQQICDLIVKNCLPQIRMQLFVPTKPKTLTELWTTAGLYQEVESELLTENTLVQGTNDGKLWDRNLRRCWACDSPSHLLNSCPKRGSGSNRAQTKLPRMHGLGSEVTFGSILQTDCWVDGKKVCATIDSGSCLSLANRESYHRLFSRFAIEPVSPKIKVVLVGGSTMELEEKVLLEVEMAKSKLQILTYLCDAIESDVLLGGDFLSQYCRSLDLSNLRMWINGSMYWTRLQWM